MQPDDGLQPVGEFIAGAQRSLLIKQFTFTEEELIRDVIDRKVAGVDVRVMLNAQRSGGDRANDETYQRFSDAGISVQWSNPKFYVTHEKSIVADERAALVATFNLCTKYFTLTHDYGIVTHDPQHVAQIVEVFNADWVIATVSMVVPAATLVYVITLFWQKAQESRLRIAVEKGFAPLTVGLILATSLVMGRAADHDWRAYLLTGACTLIFVFTKTNPLIVVGAAGVFGYFGLV